MKFTRTRAIVACTLLAGLISAPAFGQSFGLIARGDCPKAMRMAPQHSAPQHSARPAPPSTYKPVAELERYIAELQAAAPDARERPRTKRARSMPRPF